VSSPTTTLSESASKQLLAEAGVPVAAERIVATALDAAEAATAMGFPVVAKLCGDRIAHKTERGLVTLNLSSADAVADATTALFAKAVPDDGDVAVLIAPMIRGNRELIAGVATDPQFGKTIMVGVGGILAEAVADVVFRLVPITRLDAQEMIEEMATQALLGPFRGEPAVDRERLIDVLVGLSRVVERDPHIVSIDVNPLIVSNGVPIAVDALVEMSA
jgi:acetate---CoA ligase (ADP-forming) subunit beta